MKHLLVLILLLLAPMIYALDGVCVHVSDGDTITIKVGSVKEKIRLDGIDAPESKQQSGQDSKQYLAKRILNKQIRVEGSKRDKYGRLLGTVYLGEENINLTMLQQGWAWDYVQFSKGAEYTRAEKEARAAKRGLWAKASPIEPWKYRHPERYGITEAVADEQGRGDAAEYLYWVSNSGKTHNRKCKNFLGNSGTGYYTNTPSGVDAKCCGGASR